ncbi:uncharacterized protein DUF3696 [Winogradskyella eximia]|uniref:Uncharacterized protein DUF3696 n=1 Tax=Winogradskyella eximia TaxID=262006 RepID=A0A3D9GZ78_9FLAO|nr:DUF3696 domain-containing protein [Winogradskyella eximia]RED42217.1 uncharacterized protein DUF3696 [Winogradskyella eximia]
MFGIKINNFRSLNNQKFDFTKVSILIGENSSGKSSLLKFLLFLKRSTKLNSTSFRYTSELGKFDDFVYFHNEELNVSFDLSYGENYINFFNSELGSKEDWKIFCAEALSLKENQRMVNLNFSFNKDIQTTNDVSTTIENPYYGKLIISRSSKESDSVIQGNLCDLSYKSFKQNKEVKLDSVSYNQHGFLTITIGSDIKNKIEKNPDWDNTIFNEIAFLLISQNYTLEILNSISYINPIASTPERAYDENEIQGRLYKVKDIKDVVNILSDQSFDLKVRKGLLNNLNKALRLYGILHEVKTKSSEFGPKELQVKVNKDGVWSNIKDVGYGSSLQIPILFQALIGNLTGGEIIIIEQPEVHIHPLLQAKFIETLLKVGDKNTYIIETHSTDLIRKLQVMVKKETADLTSKDISIYYFKKPKNISEITFHEINENGKLIPKFPSGFYDSSVNLVKELF